MKATARKNELFETSDLNLANCICYFQHPIEAINWNNNKATFLFSHDEKLDDLVKKYWRHELFVEPVAFLNCLKEIKTRLYNVKR